MQSKLIIHAIIKFLLGLVAVGMLLFLPAGTYIIGMPGSLWGCFLSPYF